MTEPVAAIDELLTRRSEGITPREGAGMIRSTGTSADLARRALNVAAALALLALAAPLMI